MPGYSEKFTILAQRSFQHSSIDGSLNSRYFSVMKCVDERTSKKIWEASLGESKFSPSHDNDKSWAFSRESPESSSMHLPQWSLWTANSFRLFHFVSILHCCMHQSATSIEARIHTIIPEHPLSRLFATRIRPLLDDIARGFMLAMRNPLALVRSSSSLKFKNITLRSGWRW